MATRKDLGPVSAYAIALANGFTGTEAEWTSLIANASNSAQEAAESASEAAQSAQETADLVEDARTQYGSPLKATTVAEMTDTAHIYVYVGSETGYTAGNWYYHNGSAWVSGGVYNSAGINTDKTLSVEDMAADAAAVGALKEDLDTLGFTQVARNALLTVLQHVYYKDSQGQSAYDSLMDALNAVTVTSIVAVFDSGTTKIYNTSDIEDLRQYLTVTAYKSDGRSSIVNNYQLSGTLAVGTSVITVSYRDKTTTFNVTVYDNSIIYMLNTPKTFNGLDDYEDTGVALLKDNDSDWTIVFTLTDNTNVASENKNIIQATSGNNGYWVRVRNNNGNKLYDLITYGVSRTIDTAVSNDTHVIKGVIRFVHSSPRSTFDLSIDGVVAPTHMIGGASPTFTPTSIAETLLIGAGRSGSAFNGFFTGVITDFKIYNYGFGNSKTNEYISA